MKVLLSLLCIVFPSIYAVTDLTSRSHAFKTPNGVIRIEVNTYNAQDNTTTNQATARCSQQLEQLSPFPDASFSKKISSWFPDLSATQVIVSLAGLTAAGAYGYTWYQLIMGKKYLEQNQLWSSWYDTIALQDLLSIAPKEITQKLLDEIHRRHSDNSDIAHMLQPLLVFIREIEEEEALLMWYQKLHAVIVKCKMARFFPVILDPFDAITERLQRLTYYKNLFYSWAKEYAAHTSDAIIRSISLEDDTAVVPYAYELTDGYLRSLLEEHLDRITPSYNVQ